jgi:hypothetical protein
MYKWIKSLWKNVISYIWEAIFLSFSVFFMFPHILREVINNTDYGTLGEMWANFCTDIGGYWYLYLIFFISLIVWLVFKIWILYEAKKREERIGSTL